MLHGPLDQAVLVDSREALELWRGDDGAQVIAAALVEDLDVRAGERFGDEPLDLREIGQLR